MCGQDNSRLFAVGILRRTERSSDLPSDRLYHCACGDAGEVGTRSRRCHRQEIFQRVGIVPFRKVEDCVLCCEGDGDLGTQHSSPREDSRIVGPQRHWLLDTCKRLAMTPDYM